MHIFYPHEIEVVVKKLRPEDMTGRFMQENGISKINGAKCRTDPERPVQDLLAAEKCAFNLDSYLPIRLIS